MKLEKLKEEFPETPDFIHQMIEKEVTEQIKKKRKIKWSLRKTAVVAMASCLAVSTISYAGVEFYQMHLQKIGKYGTSINVGNDQSGSQAGVAKQTTVNSTLKNDTKDKETTEISDVKIKASYIPEGMEMSDGKISMHYKNQSDVGGITFDLCYFDTNKMDGVEDKNVIKSQQITFGERTGYYLKLHTLEKSGNFNQRIYLAYPEEKRVLVMYIGDNVTKEEALKIAKGIQLEETGKKIQVAKLSNWSDYNKDVAEQGANIIDTLDKNQIKTYTIGDTFAVTNLGEDKKENSKDVKLEAVINKIQVTDNVDLLDKNKIPEEWKQEIGKDGKLKENQLTYIKEGDGINTIDQIVKTKKVQQKLVIATVTYTNKSKSNYQHVLYGGNLMFLNQTNGKYQIYNYDTMSGKGYDFIEESSAAADKEVHYRSHSENYGNGGNYLSIKSGESIKIQMAWIVNQTDLSHMYLSLDGDASGYEFTDGIKNTGIVDIRQ